jgi:6-phosphogluconolactonase
MWAPDPNAASAAKRADPAYAALRLDAALLGMGADAHTASWFPQDPALDVALNPAGARSVIAVEAEGAAGATARLTLTFPALARADQIILLITGEEKRARLALAETQPATEAPIAAVLRGAPDRLTIIWAP